MQGGADLNATRAAAIFTGLVVVGLYVYLRRAPIVVNPGAGGTGNASGGSGAASGSANSSGTAGVALGALESIGEALGIVSIRGIRNNNPGNLEFDPAFTWDGQVGQDAKGYLIFDTPEHGCRALGHDLHNAIAEGYDTLDTLIAHYAPPTENNVPAYVNDVETKTGFPANVRLSPTAAPAIAGPVAQHECGDGPWTAPDGTTYSASDVSNWAALP